MTTFQTSRFAKRVLVGLCLAFCVSACAATEDTGPSSDESTITPTSVEELADGDLVLHYDLDEESMAAASAQELESKADVSIQRNCVYIEYCRSPSTGGIVCRSRTCGCTAQEAIDECVRDAQAVCGHANAMTGRLCTGG